MNISYNWLKQYVNLDIEPEEVSKILTSIGLEVGGVEEVQNIKGGLEGLVVGEVLEAENHPDSDHLHVAKVNVGQGEPLQIVCGAHNCRAGLKTIVATIGTKLYSGDESFAIKRSKLRGVESFGMLCAEDEIGIGTSHDGIIELPADAKVGTLAKDYYNVKSDYVIEVDITPNRIDAASHFGVARDLAAYFALHNPKYTLTRPDVSAFKVDNNNNPIKVTVENTDACPRYSGISISGVTVKESPEWLQNYLRTIGLRPINNVVDITNYVLQSLGQPMHAFDAEKISGKHIIVKTLAEGTKFTTLDGVERTLNAADLMICDEKGGMCIAGVFGGLDSGVTETTKNIFLESAYFNPVFVRKTARRHGLNTDASFRYERGCDPNTTIFILKFAALLVKELAGGTISSEIFDNYPVVMKPYPVEITYSRINSLIGKEITKDEVKTILKGLEIEIKSETEESLSLDVPTYRVDVLRDVDVIEDILRIYDYNRVLPDTSLKASLSYSTRPDSYKLQNLVSEQLTGCGFREILNNSLTKTAYYDDLENYPADHSVMVMNPLSADLNCMRQSLIFGGLESIVRNANRKNSDLKFYEFGNCYYFDKTKESTKEAPLAPYSEDYHLGIWISGNKTAQSWVMKQEKSSFYQLRAYVNNVLSRLGIDLKKVIVGEYSDNLLSEGLTINTPTGQRLVVMGVVSDQYLKKFDIDNDVFFADINWNNVLSAIKKFKVFATDISKFPEVKRDLALLIDKSIAFDEIVQIATETERKLLKDVYLFDVYEGKNLEAGKKSYAVTFILQDENKTLNDVQIDGIMKKMIKNYEDKLGAKIR
ncbi:MAG TPA: phenylalanine--tRNA ligase subunit beta [Paludibacteraceae bacterium]|nr:phenylalanine--tRNA ligase subunit beta [Paludibacteraceae bacterium]HOU68584.1 phenylalanine--tRNA ligase subunit beta [Paludibacteraceae bacterium]HPH63924.1 phenylalanine--tRNA ligase subunit beta [Paludibacteraceae bacterium]HQF50424.1 phenylalanine--tRNA ligase subunit beta [Paludibacteraceae bacterium]